MKCHYLVKNSVSDFFDWLILRPLAVRIFSSGPGVQTAPSFTICTIQSFHGWLKDVNWIQTTQVIEAKANLFIPKRKTYFMIKKTMFVVKH